MGHLSVRTRAKASCIGMLQHAAVYCSVLQSGLAAASLQNQTLLYSLLLNVVTGFDKKPFEAGGTLFQPGLSA